MIKMTFQNKNYKKTINVIGNKLNALIQEPYENRVEDIIKDYKEYKYKKKKMRNKFYLLV